MPQPSINGGNVETQTMSGGRALADMLEAFGGRWMFGMGGFQLLPLYDALYDKAPAFQHVLVRDERSGAFMADAFARVARTVGLCDGTLGPGATNLITGLCEAYGASIPVLAVTGEANTLLAGRGVTQECDQVSMIRPTVKDVVRVERIERLPELVRRAFATATAGRPGPVLLDVPEDVTHGTHDFARSELYADPPAHGLSSWRIRPDAAAVERAAELLGAARRPVVVAGGGVHLSDACGSLGRLVEAFRIPVATTISGKGAISEDHPLALGVCGRFSRTGNSAIEAADCVLVVGSKLGEIATRRWTLFSPATAVIQLDIDPVVLGRTTRIEVGLWGDAALGLDDLRTALSAGKPTPNGRDEYLAELATEKRGWHEQHGARLRTGQTPIHQARLIHELNRMLPDDAILVADGGFACHWSALYFDTRRAGRHYIAGRGSASIGYGLPAAIGAKLAAPERVVVGLTGDGGLAMSMAELETALRVRANVVIVVVDNATQGYVKALQQALYGGRFQSCDVLPVNYARLAKEFGLHGERVTDPDELANALGRALEADGPAVVDVMVTEDPTEMLPGVDSRTGNASR